MTADDFYTSLSGTHPASSLSAYLKSLWYDGKGDWEKAHTIIQDIEDTTAAWVHAYLHRKEGDAANAAYWYRRARRPIATGALDDEWESIVAALLA